MVNNSKKAFTLVECLMSMIIIIMVSAAVLPILTTSKKMNDTAPVTIRGQYGCWREGGKLYQWYFDERTPRTQNPQEVSGCQLKLDLRPAFYYIVASGAGGTKSRGQVITKYTDTLSGDLDIYVGKSGGTSDTTTVQSASSSTPEVTAHGGVLADDVDNGLIPENIKSCRLISKGKSCPQGGTQTSCEVISTILNGELVNKVRINGCEYDEYSTNYVDRGIIGFELFELKNGNSGSLNLKSMASNPSPDLANAGGKTYKYNNFEVNLDFDDSSYMKPAQLLGYKNNSGSNLLDVSQMSNIIEAVPYRRISELTKRLSNLNPGAKNKDGAVLIMW